MDNQQYFKSKLFKISTTDAFNALALELFTYQAKHNEVYKRYLELINVQVKSIKSVENIPFLPLHFFKKFFVKSGVYEPEVVFSSSATSGIGESKHYVKSLEHYQKVYKHIFENTFGQVNQYCILALLPSYLERSGSSLIEMCKGLISLSGDVDSGFYLDDLNQLKETLIRKEAAQKKTILIGVSFALLDFAEQHAMPLKHTVIMETGGMKGRRKELLREVLHQHLSTAFGVQTVYSEYGMTELLSQAYSVGNGIFHAPPWMRVFARQTDDPFQATGYGKTGGLNIIDLANISSCAFLETMDLGRVYKDGTFEVLGRFDHAEVRGCNLLVQ